MKLIHVLILGLLTGAAFAQDTGGAVTGGMTTGGAITGGMTDESPTVGGTIEALEGGLANLPAEQAISNIEGWQMRLESTGDPALLAIAEQLEELKAALQTESVDQASVGLLLTELGGRTSDAAQSAQGEEAAQLVSLGTLLSDAGADLSGVSVEDVTLTGGGMTGGDATGGMTGGSMTGGN